ncbi:MAG: tRNA lysidine(34) synthetase TilS [Clostridia bacterium]
MINQQLIENYDRILCGVSGGADSIALAHSLKQLEKSRDITVFACHLNHKTRGEESLRDLRFTENFCKMHDIPFYFEEIDIVLDKSQGFEASARQIRYDFFNRAAKHFNANKIATAHNADDNLETILLNISRGTGLKGLCGIPLSRQNIVRPILHKTRAEIEQYLSENGVDFIIDSSNNTDDYSRNKIRHHILPVLNEINTKATQNAFIMSKTVLLDEDYFQCVTNEVFPQIVQFDVDKYVVDIEKLLNLHHSIAYRVLNSILSNFEKTLSSSFFDKIVEKCRSKNTSFCLDLYKDVEIFREYGTIIFKAKTFQKQKLDFIVENDQIIIFTNKFNNLFINYTADYDKIDFSTLSVTNKLQGDEIRLNGGRKSLKKLFIDKKIPQKLREFVPVLRDKNGIVCVCFIGVDINRQSKNNKNILFRSNL